MPFQAVEGQTQHRNVHRFTEPGWVEINSTALFFQEECMLD